MEKGKIKKQEKSKKPLTKPAQELQNSKTEVLQKRLFKKTLQKFEQKMKLIGF